MTDEMRTTDELAGPAEPAAAAPQDPKAGGVGGSSVPVWVLVVVVALFLGCACIMMATGVGVFGYLSSSQTDAPVIIVPPTQEQPAEAPPEQPTQPPAAQPTQAPPEAPAEGQQPEEPAEAEQLPSEPDSGGSACIPLAGGLVLAPLLVLGKKSGSRRRSNP